MYVGKFSRDQQVLLTFQMYAFANDQSGTSNIMTLPLKVCNLSDKLKCRLAISRILELPK